MQVHRVSDLYKPLFLDCAHASKDALLCASTYFTTWVLLLHVILHPLPSLQGVSVLLAIIVSAAGSYLTFVHPKRLTITVGRSPYTISGPALWTTDLLTHRLPMWLVMYAYDTSKGCCKDAYIPAIAVLYVYLLCVNVKEKYDITEEDVYCILCITCAALVLNLRSNTS